jgi:hypothetical protein
MAQETPHDFGHAFRKIQELRGGSLDHEQYDMRETRETANADRYQTIPRLAGVIASGRAEVSILFQEMSAHRANIS